MGKPALRIEEMKERNPEAFAQFPSIEDFAVSEPLIEKASIEELLCEATPIQGRGQAFLHVQPMLLDMEALCKAVNQAGDLTGDEDMSAMYNRLAEAARRILWVQESAERLRPATADEIKRAFRLRRLNEILVATLMDAGLEAVAGKK